MTDLLDPKDPDALVRVATERLARSAVAEKAEAQKIEERRTLARGGPPKLRMSGSGHYIECPAYSGTGSCGCAALARQ